MCTPRPFRYYICISACICSGLAMMRLYLLLHPQLWRMKGDRYHNERIQRTSAVAAHNVAMWELVLEL